MDMGLRGDHLDTDEAAPAARHPSNVKRHTSRLALRRDHAFSVNAIPTPDAPRRAARHGCCRRAPILVGRPPGGGSAARRSRRRATRSRGQPGSSTGRRRLPRRRRWQHRGACGWLGEGAVMPLMVLAGGRVASKPVWYAANPGGARPCPGDGRPLVNRRPAPAARERTARRRTGLPTPAEPRSRGGHAA